MDYHWKVDVVTAILLRKNEILEIVPCQTFVKIRKTCLFQLLSPCRCLPICQMLSDLILSFIFIRFFVPSNPFKNKKFSMSDIDYWHATCLDTGFCCKIYGSTQSTKAHMKWSIFPFTKFIKKYTGYIYWYNCCNVLSDFWYFPWNIMSKN